ncbi:hypothetical protein HZA99_05930 [Candidatus Woesearchaeota archaeon]|nr:hypothetical protein [Candidatus Woesearchaeota archaeon]
MSSRSNTTVNKAYMEKVTKSANYQASEKKARQMHEVEKHMMHDQTMRKKEYD